LLDLKPEDSPAAVGGFDADGSAVAQLAGEFSVAANTGRMVSGFTKNSLCYARTGRGSRCNAVSPYAGAYRLKPGSYVDAVFHAPPEFDVTQRVLNHQDMITHFVRRPLTEEVRGLS
jgi:hypothetical protein